MNIVNHFMEENSIEWVKLGSLCMDGALAMMGKRSRFVAFVKEKCPDVICDTLCAPSPCPCDQDALQGAR